MNRYTIGDVQAALDIVNARTQFDYYAYYESGRAHISYRVGPGRSTVFSGTARECAHYAAGMRIVAVSLPVLTA